jgi:hypothetical protein
VHRPTIGDVTQGSDEIRNVVSADHLYIANANVLERRWPVGWHEGNRIRAQLNLCGPPLIAGDQLVFEQDTPVHVKNRFRRQQIICGHRVTPWYHDALPQGTYIKQIHDARRKEDGTGKEDTWF